MGNCCHRPVRLSHASSEIQKPSKNCQSSDYSGKRDQSSLSASKGDVPFITNLKSFTFNDLKLATKNFRSDCVIGEGGFGCVFKGWIDGNTLAPAKPGSGHVVAIKKLKIESFQGHREWLAEVSYLGQLRHENLVKLIGYCAEDENRLIVYEYMPKGSLENHLFRKNVQPISWPIRMNIAIGVARGITFLHNLETHVIYRDLKASNILLDSEFNAKLSDFGLARDGPTGDKTHVSTRVMGTRGYAAPEYVATGHLTLKSDVYSFGVVLLELLSGRRALYGRGGEEETLVDWAKPFLNDNRKMLRIIDTRLEGQYSKKAVQAVARLAVECLHTDPKNRPSMQDVLTILESLPSSRSTPVTPNSKFNQQHIMRPSYYNRRASATMN